MKKKELNQQSLALFASLFFLIATAGGFFWLWTNSKPTDVQNVLLDEKYHTVEVGSIKSQAQALVQSKGNLVQMPIKAPTENLGKEDPFVGSE